MLNILDRRRLKTAYIGWLGNNNLGDESMFQAFSMHVRSVVYPPISLMDRMKGRIRGIRSSCASVCMGGGTRIFGRSWTCLREAMNAGLRGWTFGTGVRNPDFWRKARDVPVWINEWQEVLSRCSHVSVRGPLSQKILESHGISSIVVGDPIFLFCADMLPQLPTRPVLGLNVGWANGDLWGGNDEAVLKAIVGAACAFREKGWLLRLYCVCREDLRACRNAAAQLGLGMNAIERIWNNAYSFFESVRSCSMFLGFKLHASALAYCAYIPTIAIEYRPKVRDFMASVGAESRCPRSDRINRDVLVELIDKALVDQLRIQQEQRQMALLQKSRLLDFLRLVDPPGLLEQPKH